MGRLELEVPVSSSIRSLGLRPSAFIDIGSVWSLIKPELTDIIAVCVPVAENTTLPTFNIVPGGPVSTCGATTGPTGFSRVAGIKETFLWQFAQAPPGDRRWR